MIFKTITDESTLSGQKIVGALKARQIAQQQATMQLEVDIACLKQYELACKSGTVTTEQFDTIMKKASVTAVDYAAKIKAGTGSAQSYANAQRATNAALQSTSVGATLASKAVKLFSASLNMIAFTAILAGLNWVVNKVDELIVTADEAKESADALSDSLSSFLNETQSNLKTISSLSDRFNELSKNVGANGEQIGGTTEEYEEYLGICEQVKNIMPDLVTGYTNEGQAIIVLKDNVDSLTESYEEAIRAKAALFVSDGDEQGNTIKSFFDDYNHFSQGDKGFLDMKTSPTGQDSVEDFEQYWGYDKIHGWLSNVTDATLEDLQSLRAGTSEYVYLARVLKEAGYEISEISADNYNAVHDVFNSRLTVMEQGMTDRVNNIKTAFQNMLYTDGEYWEIDDEKVISAINSVYASIDDEFIKQNNLFNQTALQTFESDLVSLFTNDATKQAMLDFYSPMSDEETVQEYTDRVKTALETIQTYCNTNGIIVPIEMGDSSEGVDTLVNDVKDKLKGTAFDDRVGELSLGDLKIASELEVPMDSIESWEELLALIQKVKDETFNNEITVSFNYDKLENLESKLSSIQSAYDSLTSAIQEYNEQGYLSMETIDTLISLDDEYINALIDENGQIQYNTKTFQNLARIKLEEAKASIYQEFCTELARIKQLDATVAANELALANGNLTLSAYETAKALYEEYIAMENVNSVNRGLAKNAWNSAQKKIALLDNQLKAVTDSTYDFSNANKDAEKSAKEYVDSYMEFMKSSLETNRIDFRTYSNDVSAFLKKMFDEGKISGKEYFDYVQEQLETEKKVMDAVISAVIYRIDEEIDRLKSEQDEIQNTIDALREANDEKERALEIEKARYELAKLQSQRTIKLYTQEKGIIYTNDHTSIREAQENLENLEFEEVINGLEKEKDALGDSIEELERYKDKWNNIQKQHEIDINKMHAKDVLGQNWEADVLSGRIDTLNNFANNYFNIQKAIADAAWNSANEQIKAAQAAQNALSGGTVDIEEEEKEKVEERQPKSYAIYKTLYTANSVSEASDHINRLGGDTIIPVGNKYLVVKWLKEFINNGQASSQLGMLNGSGIYKRYHTGLDEGYVGDKTPLSKDKRLDILQKAGNGVLLKPDEQLSILKNKELVLTEYQGINIADALWQKAMIPNMILPNYNLDNIALRNNTPSQIVNIGDIHLHEVQNVPDFAKALQKHLPNISVQYNGKH